MTLSELVKMVGDSAEIAVTILLAYLVFKLATFIEALGSKFKEEKQKIKE